MKGSFSNKGIPGAVPPTWHPHPKLCILLSVKPSLISAAINETEALSTLPLSPHPVGLITTSFSLLRPLRKARFRKLKQQKKCTRRVIRLFLNCDSAPPPWPGRPPPPPQDPSAAHTHSQRGVVGRREAGTPCHMEVYLGEKLLWELSCFHLLFFFILIIFPRYML